jgi:hypothetical protein
VENLSLSLNLFSGVVEENIQEKIMCVCVREREREILRDSKGKIAMGRKKTEQNQTKFNLRSRIKQRNNAGSSRSSRKKKKKLTEFSSIVVVVVAAARKKRKTVGVKGDEIRKRKTGVPQKR